MWGSLAMVICRPVAIQQEFYLFQVFSALSTPELLLIAFCSPLVCMRNQYPRRHTLKQKCLHNSCFAAKFPCLYSKTALMKIRFRDHRRILAQDNVVQKGAYVCMCFIMVKIMKRRHLRIYILLSRLRYNPLIFCIKQKDLVMNMSKMSSQ